MSKKKNPKDSKDETPHLGNWAIRPPVITQKLIAEEALKKLKASRKGKTFKLIPHPVKGFIEVEVTDEFNR
jgi:hypothetical protein